MNSLKNNSEKKSEALEKTAGKKSGPKEKIPYMSRGIYNNYAKSMKERNQKRKKEGIQAIPVRTFEEWSG